MATIQVTPSEVPATTRQSTAKTEAGTGEFKDMLTGALQTKDSGKTGKIEGAKTEKQPAQTEKGKKSSRPEEIAETGVPGDAEAAAQVQAALSFQEETSAGEIAAGEASVEEPQVLLAMQPLQSGQTAQISRELPEQSAPEENIQPIVAGEQAQPEQVPVTEFAEREIPQANGRPQRTEAAQRPDGLEAPQSQREARTQTAEIPREAAADVVSARVAAQAPETVPTELIRPIIRPGETQDARFGEMLTKASQELGQNRAIPETPEEPEAVAIAEADLTLEEPEAVAVVETDLLSVETEADETAETDLEPKERQAAIEGDTEAEAKKPQAAAARDTTVRFEQRPLKEMPKTDEAVLGLVQPKPETGIPEVGLREQIPEAQPVRVPDQAEQIRVQVVENLEREKLEFNMQLQPKELGRVDVKMVLESGRLTMEIVAASSKSTELLSKQVDGLVASLKLSGIDISSVNVVTARQDVDGHMESPYNPGNFQNQSGGDGERGEYGANGGGSAGNPGDYAEARPEDTGTTPQRLLNYSV